MDHPYSFWADWLSKFYLASEPIQALWIVALAATVLGALGFVTHGVVEIFGTRRRSRAEPGEQIVWPRPVGIDPRPSSPRRPSPALIQAATF
jgi:hypothetical protein